SGIRHRLRSLDGLRRSARGGTRTSGSVVCGSTGVPGGRYTSSRCLHPRVSAIRIFAHSSSRLLPPAPPALAPFLTSIPPTRTANFDGGGDNAIDIVGWRHTSSNSRQIPKAFGISTTRGDADVAERTSNRRELKVRFDQAWGYHQRRERADRDS